MIMERGIQVVGDILLKLKTDFKSSSCMAKLEYFVGGVTLRSHRNLWGRKLQLIRIVLIWKGV